ncbi:hypothetical protein YN1_1400 [Nanoarchaeota archaeon]
MISNKSLKDSIKKIINEHFKADTNNNDLIYNYIEESKNKLLKILYDNVLKIEDDGNLEDLIKFMLEEKYLKKFKSLEDALIYSISYNLANLTYKNCVNIFIELENTNDYEIYRKKVIYYTKSLGHLLSSDIVSKVNKKELRNATIRVSGYILPVIKNKEEILQVIPSISENIKDEYCNAVNNKNSEKARNFLNNEKALEIFKEYCNNQCSIIKYYEQLNKDIAKGLYVFTEYHDIVKEVSDIRKNARYEEYCDAWRDIEKAIINKMYENNNFNFLEVLKYIETIRNVNNNIRFWYNIIDNCKDRI